MNIMVVIPVVLLLIAIPFLYTKAMNGHITDRLPGRCNIRT